MNYEEFCAAIQEELFHHLEHNCSVHRERILKINGLVLDSLTILESGKHCSPVIPLEQLYKDFLHGCTISELCESIISVTSAGLPSAASKIDFIKDLNQCRNRIICRLISHEKNEEFLENVPWIPCLDLAVIFALSIQSEGETQISSVITNSVAASWNLSARDLLTIARENTSKLFPSTFRCLERVIGDFLPVSMDIFPEEAAGPMLYVLSNTVAHYGAACILYPDQLKNLADLFGSDLLILPSSIHEVLIMADSELFSAHDYFVFSDTVRKVNRDVVRPEEFLSDHLYRYSRGGDCLEICEEAEHETLETCF